jgi:hypothetical protein
VPTDDQSEEAALPSPPFKRQRTGTPHAPVSSSTSSRQGASRRTNIEAVEEEGLVDPSSFTKFKYNLNQHDVGKIFHDFQVAGAKMVNDSKVSVTLDNMSVFL